MGHRAYTTEMTQQPCGPEGLARALGEGPAVDMGGRVEQPLLRPLQELPGDILGELRSRG